MYPASQPIAGVSRPTPRHFGIYVTDLPRMVDFYTQVFDLTITDRGVGKRFKSELVFTSATPDQHHQLVLASGRPADATFSTVMQISFMVPAIQSLRDIRQKSLDRGASGMREMNHGNALSIYFEDPEGNTVEVYLDTPFYIAQPHSDLLDLSLSDEAIMQLTETTCRADPTFMPLHEWQARFVKLAPAASA
jgi:catechol 2,3-dioxygenase